MMVCPQETVGEMRSAGLESSGMWLSRGVLGCKGGGTIMRFGGSME